MMKKLLVVMLVLGLASIANADLVFTVDGQEQPPEITLMTSDEIVLDLHLAAGQNILKYMLTYELNNEQAEFVLPEPLNPPTYGIAFPWASMFPGKVNHYDGEDDIEDDLISWVEIVADNFMTPDDPLDLMEGLIIRCLEDTDVVMTVTVSGSTTINGELIPVDTLMHTLTIHQVPEPATMALLGLGGLFLRRRRK